MQPTPATNGVRYDRAHNKLVKWGFYVFFLSLFDFFLIIASRQTIVFLIQLLIVVSVVGMIAIIRLVDSRALYFPLLLDAFVGMLLQLAFILVTLIVCLFFCSIHEGCVEGLIYYLLNIVARLLIAWGLYRIYYYAKRASKIEQVSEAQRNQRETAAIAKQRMLTEASSRQAAAQAKELED
jgi:hypothetical protein